MVEPMTGCAPHVPNETKRVELLPIMVDVARTEIADLRARLDAVERERDALRECLNPLRWTPEMVKAWHTAIPDLREAFAALSRAALTPSHG